MLNDIYQALDPVAFSIGAVQVRWYGLAYIAGFVLAGLTMYLTGGAGSSACAGTTSSWSSSASPLA